MKPSDCSGKAAFSFQKPVRAGLQGNKRFCLPLGPSPPGLQAGEGVPSGGVSLPRMQLGGEAINDGMCKCCWLNR